MSDLAPPAPGEGYVLATYGPEKYLHQAVASAATLRRHDARRPVALYAPDAHRAALQAHGLAGLFWRVLPLPEAHRSVIGVKHHLHRFMPFDRTMWVDADLVWCRDPDPLWRMCSAYAFTSTGLERADVWFGGPKNAAIVADWLLDRRRRTMHRLGLTHLPRVLSALVYAQDRDLARRVCEAASGYLARQDETHFRRRLDQERGRTATEESCEWSLALAMSTLGLPVLPWFQGANSPLLDHVAGLTTHDADFRRVRCRYYADPFVYGTRTLPSPALRRALLSALSRLPGRGDYLDVVPFALHFGLLHEKAPWIAFAERVWGEGLPGELAPSPGV